MKTNNLLKKTLLVIIHLFFLTLFLGFILGGLGRIPMGQGSIAISILDIGVLLTTLSGFIYYLYIKKPLIFPFIKPLGCFILIASVSLVINLYRFSFEQIFISSLYLIRWIVYVGIFYLFVNFSISLKKKILPAMVLLGGIMILLGYIQYFFYSSLGNLFYLGWDDHMYRMFSTFLDPNFCGVFFSLFTIFLMYFYFKAKLSKTKRILLLSLISLSLGAIYITYSRTALVSFLISSSLLLVLLGKKKLIGGIFTLTLLVIFIISKDFYIENKNLFRSFSTKERVTSYVHAVTIIKDNFLLGVGFNTYRYVQIEYGFRSAIGAGTSHADAGTDNSLLLIFATTGVLGVIAYLYFYITILRSAINVYAKEKKKFSIVVIASLVCLFSSSFFINSLLYPPLMLWMWSLIGVMDYK